MNIFSADHVTEVQQVIEQQNGQQTNNGHVEVKDEISELNEQSKHIQQLLAQIEQHPDEKARKLMQECMQEILSFYGHGLEKILGVINHAKNNAARDIINNLLDDSFISGLLLIHDLHPLDLNTRLHMAIDKVKPYINSHGGSVEILSLDDGVAHLRFAGNCKGCPSSSSTLELGIRQAVEELCPDLEGLEVEGITDNQRPDKSKAFLFEWKEISGLNNMPNDHMRAVEMPGAKLLVCKVDDKLYAYGNHCPACNTTFSNGHLENAVLSCASGHRFDVKQAGAGIDDKTLHLDPYPLLEENGSVRVAV